MSTFWQRVTRAARLDAALYEEVEADAGLLGEAMAVVVLSSVAAGIGTLSTTGMGGIVVGTLGALLGWFVWAYLTYFIGTRWLPEPQTEADFGQLLRTTGFSSAPGLIRIAAILPALTQLLFVVASVWMLIAMVVAVRQALDYKSTGRAVVVCLIGWVIQAIIIVIVFSVLGPSRL